MSGPPARIGNQQAGCLEKSRPVADELMVQRHRACSQTDGAEQVHTITDLLQENIGEGIPIAALCVSQFFHRIFRALSDWGFRCVRASGEVDSGGRAKKLVLVWPSSERGDMVRAGQQGRWHGWASSERGNGVRPRMGKRGGRRVKDGEESALNLNSTSTTTRIYRPSEFK